MARQRDLQCARGLFARLSQAGFSDEGVARWFALPRVTDARWAPAPPAAERPRRGLGGWMALWVAGEAVEAAALRPLPSAPERAALVALALAADDGVMLTPRARLLPWRGLVVASAADEAFDLSALNVAATLPLAALSAGGSLWDVGCGAGLLSLVAARAGGRVFGSDVDAALVEQARDNAALNGLDATFAPGDLWSAAPDDARFDTIVFNAPLLRAPLAAAAGEAPRYSSATGGEALALAFLAGVAARLRVNGHVLLHAQLTPAVSTALAGWATRAAVLSVVFAHAPDGTPHALTELVTGPVAGWRRVEVPLSPACPHLSRPIFDGLGQAAGRSRALDDTTTPIVASWLELRTSERFDGQGRRTLERRFGGAPIDDGDVALLDRLRGQPVGALALAADERERLSTFIARGWVIAS
jgi:SAM-dependent methyltransferase